MNILFTGSIDGEILDFYSRVLSLEKEKKIGIDWIFAVGDFGIWPDPQRLDRATKARNKTAGDFPYLYLNQWQAPRQTVIIEGVHEDHDWIEKRIASGNLELMPNISLLANGSHLTVDGISLTGVGKSYSGSTFFNYKKSNKNYTANDIVNACGLPADILLSYEPPAGKTVGKFKSIAIGIEDILKKCNVKLHVYSTPYHGIKASGKGGLQSVALGKRQILLVEYENGSFSLKV